MQINLTILLFHILLFVSATAACQYDGLLQKPFVLLKAFQLIPKACIFFSLLMIQKKKQILKRWAYARSL